jgi:histidine triad (HIT) family protein
MAAPNESCIFCKIIKGEIPSTKVYEDGDFLSFSTIEPVFDGHILIVPKKHIIWMQDADDETISEIFKLSKKLMLAIKKGIGCDYVQLDVEGNEVPHFHIHLIPRYTNDGLPAFPTKKYKDGEVEEIVKKIISAIS